MSHQKIINNYNSDFYFKNTASKFMKIRISLLDNYESRGKQIKSIYTVIMTSQPKNEEILINDIHFPGIVLKFNYFKRLTRFSAFKC